MQYAVGMQYIVGMQYAVGVSAKRSTHTLHLAIWVVGTITFSVKRSNPTQWGMHYAVGVRTKSILCELTFLHQHLVHTTSSLHGFDLFALKVTVPTTHIC